MFTPDFYLPEHDMYLELTTMKQSLVTPKNRKVRLLRELYPDVNVKIFYQRDYLRLLEKYGLDGDGAEREARAALETESWATIRAAMARTIHGARPPPTTSEDRTG